MLIGLEKEDLSDKLGDQIIRLSPYLQEVQRAIRDSIFYQKNAKEYSQMEKEIFTRKGLKEKKPGVWTYNGEEILQDDYPVNLEEQEKGRKNRRRYEEKGTNS